MKKIIGILLIGLLGFLGCSDSDDATRTVDQATPVAPWAIIETSTPTYEWTPVQYATKYRLIVQDTNQESTTQDTTETYIIDEWYTAEESGCSSDDGLCMVTPDIEVFEENTWKIQACANDECGLWSEQLNFDFTLMTAPRFTDHGDGTVTDNNTTLIWSKNANREGRNDWWGGLDRCDVLLLADLSDWRLPVLSELKSLVDDSQWDPALPPGHPFTNVQFDYYWSSSPLDPGSNHMWGVAFSGGDVTFFDEARQLFVWCVHGGD